MPKQKDITDIVVREIKCFWKTKLGNSEAVALKKEGINFYNKCTCNFCTGYDKKCHSYVRRAIHYIPNEKR